MFHDRASAASARCRDRLLTRFAASATAVQPSVRSRYWDGVIAPEVIVFVPRLVLQPCLQGHGWSTNRSTGRRLRHLLVRARDRARPAGLARRPAVPQRVLG